MHQHARLGHIISMSVFHLEVINLYRLLQMSNRDCFHFRGPTVQQQNLFPGSQFPGGLEPIPFHIERVGRGGVYRFAVYGHMGDIFISKICRTAIMERNLKLLRAEISHCYVTVNYSFLTSQIIFLTLLYYYLLSLLMIIL